MFDESFRSAEAEYQAWNSEFFVKDGYNYFEGRQARNPDDYIFNMIHPTLSVKLSQLLIPRPAFTVSPSPGARLFNLTTATNSSAVKEALLNSIVVTLPNLAKEIRRAVRDSFFGFGVVQVGYSENVDNPNHPTSIEFDSDAVIDDNTVDKEAKKYARWLKTARETPLDVFNGLFVRRIKHWRFRVSDTSGEDLETVPWYGFYFYKTVKAMEEYGWKLPAEMKITEAAKTSVKNGIKIEKGVKVWVIWDNLVKMKKYVLDTGHILYQESFTRKSIFSLRWMERSYGFYPIPPVYNWISPQNEINDTRNTMRNCRRAAIPHYTAVNGRIDESELQRLLGADEPTIIKVNGPGAIEQLKSLQIPSSIKDSFVLGREEFNVLAGTTPERQGLGDRTTATQVNVIDRIASERESETKQLIETFYCEIAKELLLTAIERLPVVVIPKMTGVPQENLLGMLSEQLDEFSLVDTRTLNDGVDITVTLSPDEGSPLQQRMEREAFISFLSLTTQFPMISLSADLIAEAAFRVGFKNMKIIASMQQAALMQQIMQQMQAQAQMGGGGENNFAKRQIAQQSPNGVEEIRSQLNNQMGAN